MVSNVSTENHKATNRVAEVIATPIFYSGDIKPGDEILVNHNVFRIMYDGKGNVANSRSYLEDGLYALDKDQFYMYRKPGGDWIAVDGYCFVEPTKVGNDNVLNVSDKTDLHGVMRYPDRSLIDQECKKGDVVMFTPESEYEFDVNGKTLYRVYSHDIVCVYE